MSFAWAGCPWGGGSLVATAQGQGPKAAGLACFSVCTQGWAGVSLSPSSYEQWPPGWGAMGLWPPLPSPSLIHSWPAQAALGPSPILAAAGIMTSIWFTEGLLCRSGEETVTNLFKILKGGRERGGWSGDCSLHWVPFTLWPVPAHL